MSSFGKGLAIVLVPLAIIAVVVGGYLGGWWLKADSTDRQVEIDNRNTGTQTAWRDEAENEVQRFLTLPDEPANQAARASLRDGACDLIGRLSDPYVTDQLADFQTQECS